MGTSPAPLFSCKWSSWDLNQCLDTRMPVLQVVANFLYYRNSPPSNIIDHCVPEIIPFTGILTQTWLPTQPLFP